MKWFSNLKIRVKLIVCFVALAVFTAVVGIVGISNMSKINQSADEMYKGNFVPAVELAEVQRNMLYIRSNFLLMIYEKDPSKLQQRVDEVNKWTEANNKLLAHYDTTITITEERNMYNQLNSTDIPSYRAIRSDVIKLLQAGKNEEAAAKVPEFAAAREKVESGFEKLIALNKLYAEKANKTNDEVFKNQTILMVVVAVIGVVLAILLGSIVAGIISKPLHQLLSIANKMAEGDLNVTVDIDSQDEVGILAEAFRKMSNNINEVISNIRSASEQVASGARQVSDSSMALSQGATEQASSIQQLTASLEEISSQTKLNADSANQANSLAEVAKANAIHGNGQMKEMLNAMEEINDSSSNISKIIKVIDEIAFQTNILALNAAVEAARAGQHGKGFAVVAEEVRNLAARSANAAKETTDMIEGSIKKVDGGTRIANQTADALNKIVGDITKAADLVGDIAVASNEQAAGIQQINQGIMQISQVVQTNSATSEESAAASEELSSQAELLKEQVARFRLKKSNNDIRMYTGMEDIHPGVVNMLEQMNHKKRYSTIYEANMEAAPAAPKISLSDKDFGKY